MKHCVTQDMLKDYKSFLRLQYVSRNEDLEGEKFEIKNIAWLNFGYGERVNDKGDLELAHHPESVFIRFLINPTITAESFLYKKETMY